jgi:hypothetical protein
MEILGPVVQIPEPAMLDRSQQLAVGDLVAHQLEFLTTVKRHRAS